VLVHGLLPSPYHLAMPPKLTMLLLTALTVLACALPASIAAAELVPPGNSAVNQYTETFPTSKGEEIEKGDKKSGATPNQVLGAGKAHKLEDKGTAGKAVADFTAETAPTTSSDSGSGSDENAGNDNGGNKGKGDGKGTKPATGDKGGNGNGEQQEGSAGGGGSASTGGGPSGSSGVGEIASQATGTASDSIGLWLPLILIAVVIWSAAYVWRNRQQRVV
jgi:hypothetical protein